MKKSTIWDIIIIGAGAAGLSAAVEAKSCNEKLSILILEKNEIFGKKILATGNGRCNISNSYANTSSDTMAWFQKNGVEVREEEEGRLYPYCEEAKAVVAALSKSISTKGIMAKPSFEVTGITKTEDVFIVTAKGKEGQEKSKEFDYVAKKVLVSVGGKAAPNLGSSGDGYAWAKYFGHTISRLYPVLTPIESMDINDYLEKNRVKGSVTLKKGNETVAREEGEIQFIKNGISGICTYNISRFLEGNIGNAFEDRFADYTIVLNFFHQGKERLLSILQRRNGKREFEGIDIFTSILKKPISKFVFEKARIDCQKEVYSERELLALASEATNCKIVPSNAKGWKWAQATKGGITLEEIKGETMESTLCKGLYFAGEIIDYDGKCGGYNLENAWHTGIKSGRAMADV